MVHSSHCHPQHSGRDRRLRSHLPGYRIPAQGVSLFPAFRPGGTSGGTAGVACAAARYERYDLWTSFCRGSRNHGIHLSRRTAARCSDVRRAPSFHLWADLRYGRHGGELAFVFINLMAFRFGHLVFRRSSRRHSTRSSPLSRSSPAFGSPLPTDPSTCWMSPFPLWTAICRISWR